MIYLDSAATTFQKPPEVAESVQKALETMSSPGRGGYPAAMRAAETAFACREELAGLFGVQDPERVVFTSSATHGLNIAIKSLVPPGGRVVISGYEHNAVTRPLAALGAEVVVASVPLFQGGKSLDVFRDALTPGTSAVICNHVSNVFGFVQPVEEIARLCQERKIPLVIDASQSAGVLEVNLEALGASFIAMPGHKGLYGPQGTGVLLCGSQTAVIPLLHGGTGSRSDCQEMPEFLPDRLEAGTHNIPGIAGLLAGVRYVKSRSLRSICCKERQLAHMTAQLLGQVPGITVYAQPDLRWQTGVVSFVPENQDVEALARKLADQGIAVRAGLHCAPLAHQTAGTWKTGTVRLSFSDFNTVEDVRKSVAVIQNCLV